MTPGEYTFPFTLYLPECLPQTTLAYDSADPENKPSGLKGKNGLISEARIEYNLIVTVRGIKHAMVESLHHQDLPIVSNLQQITPITILVPLLTEKISNSVIE